MKIRGRKPSEITLDELADIALPHSLTDVLGQQKIALFLHRERRKFPAPPAQEASMTRIDITPADLDQARDELGITERIPQEFRQAITMHRTRGERGENVILAVNTSRVPLDLHDDLNDLVTRLYRWLDNAPREADEQITVELRIDGHDLTSAYRGLPPVESEHVEGPQPPEIPEAAPAPAPPRNLQPVRAEQILGAIEGYTIISADTDPATPGATWLQLQAPELPDIQLKIEGGHWTALVADTQG